MEKVRLLEAFIASGHLPQEGTKQRYNVHQVSRCFEPSTSLNLPAAYTPMLSTTGIRHTERNARHQEYYWYEFHVHGLQDSFY